LRGRTDLPLLFLQRGFLDRERALTQQEDPRELWEEHRA